MLQQDYLMRLLLQFAEGVRRSIGHARFDPREAADSLEEELSRVMDMDADVLLGLAPESFASIARIAVADERIVVYIVFTMALEAHYLRRAGRGSTAALRYGQACALADACGVQAPSPNDIPDESDFAVLFVEDGIGEGA